MTAGRRINTSSQSWCTPRKYVDAVKAFFGGRIDLDPCSNVYSIVEAETEYSIPDNDGLEESWDFPTIYVNPPYGIDKIRGTAIRDWLSKCAFSHKEYGSEVVALIPVAPNTSHWKKYIFGQADAVCFLYDTRLRFLIDGKDDGKGAPMACCLVYWGDRINDFQSHFDPFGATVTIRDLKDRKFGVDRAELHPVLFKDV